MKVTVQLKRRDLPIGTLLSMVRKKSFYALVFASIVAVFSILYFGSGHPEDFPTLTKMIERSVLLGCGLVFFSFLIVFVFTSIHAEFQRDIFRENIFEIEKDGLRIETSQGEFNIPWKEIRFIASYNYCTYFATSVINSLIVPRRCFSSKHDYNLFAEQSQTYWKEARQKSTS